MKCSSYSIRLPQLLLYTLLNTLKIIPTQWKLREFKFTAVNHIIGAALIIIGCFICNYQI